MTEHEHMYRHVQQVWQVDALPALKEYIRIPNKSPAFDPEWSAHGHMDHAVELLQRWAETRQIKGLSCDVVRLAGRTPVLFCEIPASVSDNTHMGTEPTVLLYGHYDKQPEFDGWHDGLAPWVPVERDGKLYGRGGADDGYALFASLIAIEAVQQSDGNHPRCVILIEGCEESGSFDLPFYVDALRTRIGDARLVVCLDAECGNYDQLWATTSLRGMLPGVLKVDVLHEGQHSGAAGGIVPSSFRILRNLLDRIENSETGELHESLYVDIPDEVTEAARDVAHVLGRDIVDRFPWVSSASSRSSADLQGANDFSNALIANTWAPSLATVGLDGAPAIADAGNTLRPGTAAKLVFRLPPTLDAETAASAIKHILEADPPYGTRVSFQVETPQTGWQAPAEALWLSKALALVGQRYFQKPVMHMGMGGTIPFMKMLGDAYPNTQFFVTGVLGPQSNAHGPNEFLHIETATRLTACVADLLGLATAHLNSDDYSQHEESP